MTLLLGLVAVVCSDQTFKTIEPEFIQGDNFFAIAYVSAELVAVIKETSDTASELLSYSELLPICPFQFPWYPPTIPLSAMRETSQ